MIFQDEEMNSALEKLRRLGTARDRKIDHEPRTITLTDDEALALLLMIELLEALDEATEPRT